MLKGKQINSELICASGFQKTNPFYANIQHFNPTNLHLKLTSSNTSNSKFKQPYSLKLDRKKGKYILGQHIIM